MGQQQLLLLVLSTVIVGLATVAGIQAFSENQTQATQDALVQRAITIGNDMVSVHEKPDQFGGVDLTTDGATAVANAIGVDHSSGAEIPADGAGSSAGCKITANGTPAKVECSDDGMNTNYASGDLTVTVDVEPSANEPVKTSLIDGNSL